MKKGNSLIAWYRAFEDKHKTLCEIIRFIIIGGIATIIDWLVMGIVLYCFEPSLYPKFYNVWIGKIGEPKTIATVIGTGVGFTVSLFFNYILSCIFVYKEEGNSKTAKGRILFVVLSVIGLLINMLGMWIGRDLCHINEWITKVIMTIIVLVYNYISRKKIIFKADKKSEDLEKNIDNQSEITKSSSEIVDGFEDKNINS